MAQPHLEIFASEYHMLQFFGKYLPKLDVQASGRLAKFLYSYDGNFVLARNLYEFLTQIEELTALGIDTLASVQKGPSFLVFFHDTPKCPVQFVVNSEAASVIAATIIKPQESAAPVVTTEILEVTVPDTIDEVKVAEVKELTEDQLAILAQAEALRDDSKKAASKAALEAFAVEHGVSLSKAKTFDAMLEDLKAAL